MDTIEITPDPTNETTSRKRLLTIAALSTVAVVGVVAVVNRFRASEDETGGDPTTA